MLPRMVRALWRRARQNKRQELPLKEKRMSEKFKPGDAVTISGNNLAGMSAVVIQEEEGMIICRITSTYFASGHSMERFLVAIDPADLALVYPAPPQGKQPEIELV
jgi:hypothetical protein